jgi:hypothetical protein
VAPVAGCPRPRPAVAAAAAAVAAAADDRPFRCPPPRLAPGERGFAPAAESVRRGRDTGPRPCAAATLRSGRCAAATLRSGRCAAAMLRSG